MILSCRLPVHRFRLASDSGVSLLQVNADPYGEGWIVKIRMSDPSELGVLLSADDYAKLIG